MSEVKQDGGPAFPAMHFDLAENEHGVSLRDWFAAKALPVVASGSHLMGKDFLHSDQFASAAFDAYKMADAMLRAREQA